MDWLNQWLPIEMKNVALAVLGLFPAALLGRVLYHHQMVSDGRRDKFWSVALLWEGPTALFCAILSGGVTSHFGGDLFVANAVAGLLGWLGPRGLQWILVKIVERYTPPKSKNEA